MMLRVYTSPPPSFDTATDMTYFRYDRPLIQYRSGNVESQIRNGDFPVEPEEEGRERDGDRK
jgi:hypothetical protein